MWVIFDTGSDWLCVESASCESCYGTNFDEAQSETIRKVNETLGAREYGSAKLSGYEVVDQVCLDPEGYCVEDFKWFLIEDQFGIHK